MHVYVYENYIIIIVLKCTDLGTKGENILDTPCVPCHSSGCPLTSQKVVSYEFP